MIVVFHCQALDLALRPQDRFDDRGDLFDGSCCFEDSPTIHGTYGTCSGSSNQPCEHVDRVPVQVVPRSVIPSSPIHSFEGDYDQIHPEPEDYQATSNCQG